MAPGLLTEHGGNLQKITATCKGLPDKILDFSSNFNPLGPPANLKKIIMPNIRLLKTYPDPECTTARENIGHGIGVTPENILLGNGSNELIHLIPRGLGCRRALLYQPAFSEYELAVKLSGARASFLFAREDCGFSFDIKKIIRCVPKNDLVILGNPNNPTGALLEKNVLCDLAKICARYNTSLVIDEAFMDFVDQKEKFSAVSEVERFRNLLVVKSMTKFFCLAGLRVGYAVGAARLIRRLAHLQPAWSVNALAQHIVSDGIFDPDYAKRTLGTVNRERRFLFSELKKIKNIKSYPAAANFILCKISKKGPDAPTLLKRLIRDGILIRDCSNFRGLGSYFFRVAVRKRKDNMRLLESLKPVLG